MASIILSLILTCSFGGELDPNPPGIKVGERAPNFTLRDQNGKERSLKDLLKQGTVAIVFYRSARW